MSAARLGVSVMPLENRHAVFAGLATGARPRRRRANLSPEEIDVTLNAFRPMLAPSA